MFLVRWVGWFLSLPLYWAGRLAAMFRMPVSAPLLKAAWLAGGDGGVALTALVCIQQYVSKEAARAEAAAWMASRPRPEIAAYAGLLALGAGQLEYAREMLVRGQQAGADRGAMLEMLEIALVDVTGGPQALTELARRFESRRDLSPAISRLVHFHLLREAMIEGRLDEVRQRAEHLSSIENDPLVAVASWVSAPYRRGLEGLAAALAPFSLRQAERLHLQILGCLSAGMLDDARRLLAMLQQTDPAAAAKAELLLKRKESAA